LKIARIPDPLEVLVFDMDGTLYTNAAYGRQQEDSQVSRLARHLSISNGEAAAMLGRARDERREQGLSGTSMANLFLSFGVDMATIVRWRQEEIVPSRWLSADRELDAALGILSGRYRLALLTNNPRSVGEASLAALGIASRFEVVVGLDDSLESKPQPGPFLKVCECLGESPARCLSIGDREAVDILPALELGMGAILVSGVRDVYRLPGILMRRNA